MNTQDFILKMVLTIIIYKYLKKNISSLLIVIYILNLINITCKYTLTSYNMYLHTNTRSTSFIFNCEYYIFIKQNNTISMMRKIFVELFVTIS